MAEKAVVNRERTLAETRRGKAPRGFRREGSEVHRATAAEVECLIEAGAEEEKIGAVRGTLRLIPAADAWEACTQDTAKIMRAREEKSADAEAGQAGTLREVLHLDAQATIGQIR